MIVTTDVDLNKMVPVGEREEEGLLWKAYGDVDHNKLYIEVVLKNGKKIIGAVDSNVISPPMIERIYGIDAEDEKSLNDLMQEMIQYLNEDRNSSDRI